MRCFIISSILIYALHLDKNSIFPICIHVDASDLTARDGSGSGFGPDDGARIDLDQEVITRKSATVSVLI